MITTTGTIITLIGLCVWFLTILYIVIGTVCIRKDAQIKELENNPQSVLSKTYAEYTKEIRSKKEKYINLFVIYIGTLLSLLLLTVGTLITIF